MEKLVKDYMTEMPHTIGDNISIEKAREFMKEYSCRHLPVLHGGKVVGILSDRDINLITSLSEELDLPVSEAMTQDPYTVGADTPLKVAVAEMCAKKYGSVVVVGDNNKPLGIFTASNALEALLAFL